ncbi:hypothetical protein Pmar_PMAR015839 [Perkinsus marinus ATCC 50983]|uniref:PX domain-containing protein n=1 Tax=Perkinsus marinus (strain ATCC 50983 / TXsc) TaxID=423536 RepID=C5K890_PERM5|nr:hypothetical protein Pmar_PMAR015839 [Perkinsus marinus ATCC 50983]EER19278.1 hypothetical protein Pmar_PMAR015839 [Perkinsus marinus ATCC 50983]|eukprot:XP_002787482.1 hypothetical protein Pmar_PMAR015839 [Perkinsus marinus ATCC 50983]
MSSPKTTEPTLPIHHDSEVADYDDGDVTRRNEEEAAAATGTEAQFEVTVSPMEFNKLFRSGSMTIEDQGVTVSVTDPQTKRAGPAGIHKITTYAVTVTGASGVSSNTRKRYTDFTVLREELVRSLPGMFVPPLASKSQFHVLLKQPTTAVMNQIKPTDRVIEARRQSLEEFLTRCCARPWLRNSPIMAAFLSTQENTYETAKKEFASKSMESLIEDFNRAIYDREVPEFQAGLQRDVSAAVEGGEDDHQKQQQEDGSGSKENEKPSDEGENGEEPEEGTPAESSGSQIDVKPLLTTAKTYLGDHKSALKKLLSQLSTSAESFNKATTALGLCHYKLQDMNTIATQGAGHALCAAENEKDIVRVNLADAFYEQKNILSTPAQAFHLELLASVIQREVIDCSAMMESLDKVVELGDSRDKLNDKIRQKKGGSSSKKGGMSSMLKHPVKSVEGTFKTATAAVGGSESMQKLCDQRDMVEAYYWRTGYNATIIEMKNFMHSKTAVYNEVAKEFVKRTTETHKQLAELWGKVAALNEGEQAAVGQPSDGNE